MCKCIHKSYGSLILSLNGDKFSILLISNVRIIYMCCKQQKCYAEELNINIIMLAVFIPSKIKILLVKNDTTGKAMITTQWNNTVLKTCSSGNSWKWNNTLKILTNWNI